MTKKQQKKKLKNSLDIKDDRYYNNKISNTNLDKKTALIQEIIEIINFQNIIALDMLTYTQCLLL